MGTLIILSNQLADEFEIKSIFRIKGCFLFILYPVYDLICHLSNNGYFLLNLYISFKFNYVTLWNLETHLFFSSLELNNLEFWNRVSGSK